MLSIVIEIDNDFRILSLNEINEIDFYFKLAFINNDVDINDFFKDLNDFSMGRFFDFHEKILRKNKNVALFNKKKDDGE